jgi:hypothetical protein
MTQYKLVPIEPTPKMINAAQDLKPVGRWHKQIKEVFKAMLEASPTTDTVTLSKADYDSMVIALKGAKAYFDTDGDVSASSEAQIIKQIDQALDSAKGE